MTAAAFALLIDGSTVGRSRAQLDRALAKRAWLGPVAVTIFGGVDPPGRGKRPQRDLRNWQAIHALTADTLATAARAPGEPQQARSAHGGGTVNRSVGAVVVFAEHVLAATQAPCHRL